MSIKKLFFEAALVLVLITLLVLSINSFQARRNSARNVDYLQQQYLNATFEIYKNEIIGDVLVGNQTILNSLLQEIKKSRQVGVVLTYDKASLNTGKYESQSPRLSYRLNLGNKQFAKIELYPLTSMKLFGFVNTLLLPLLLEMLVLGLGFVWLLRRIKHKLLDPLNELVLSLEKGDIEQFSPKPQTVTELKSLCQTVQKMTVDLRKQTQYEAEAVTAKQVAHDIRSPLACLNLLLSYVTSLPEKQRVLMRSSIQRITDITNLLQTKGNKDQFSPVEKHQKQTVMMSSLLESLVTEKRVRIDVLPTIGIDLRLEQAYGLFAEINVVEFKRALSNLIDNAIEAFDDKPHQILITINADQHRVMIKIADDGKGMSAVVLKKLGQQGFSHGKDSSKQAGSGLGVHHAMGVIKACGGQLTIDSKVNVGTSVLIEIPQSSPPEWFVSKVCLADVNLVVVLDDDDSIHEMWRDKLGRVAAQCSFLCKHFTSIQAFEQFFEHELVEQLNRVVFLVDYEFVGQASNGLSVIERCGIQQQAILVTSHCDDIALRERVIALKMGIIPKSMVPYIPMREGDYCPDLAN